VRATAPDAVEVEWSLTDDALVWSVANRSDGPVGVDAVAVVLTLPEPAPPVRFLRHGYQSWSPTAVATFGIDQDPTRAAGVRSLPIGMHHADWARAEEGELRSELVTAVRDAAGWLLVAGFLGGCPIGVVHADRQRPHAWRARRVLVDAERGHRGR